MKVEAKCIARAWDSQACVLFYPGEVSTIEHDGHLAELKVGDKFVFEFDRTMSGTGCSPAIGGFVCRVCKRSFDTLNLLGTHTRSAHNDTPLVNRPADVDDEKIQLDGRGKKKNKTFTCKDCGETVPNLYALRVHKKGHRQAAETTPVPA